MGNWEHPSFCGYQQILDGSNPEIWAENHKLWPYLTWDDVKSEPPPFMVGGMGWFMAGLTQHMWLRGT